MGLRESNKTLGESVKTLSEGVRRKPIQTDDYDLMPEVKRSRTKSGKLSLRLRQYLPVTPTTGTPADFPEKLGEGHEFYGLEPGAEAMERFDDAVGQWDKVAKSMSKRQRIIASVLKKRGTSIFNKKELLKPGQTKIVTKLFQIAHKLEAMADA